MKTADRVLTEWAIDEIHFDGGGNEKTWTRETFSGLAALFSISSVPQAEQFLEVLGPKPVIDKDMFTCFQRGRRWAVVIDVEFLLWFESLLELVLYFDYHGWGVGYEHYPLYWSRENADIYNEMIEKMVDVRPRWMFNR
jgi:hypothetical protein